LKAEAYLTNECGVVEGLSLDLRRLLMKRLHLVFLVIALVASEWVVVASQQDSSMARFNSPEEKAKRERKHAEIDKLTKHVALQVRESEKNWAFEKSTRGDGVPDKDNKSIVYVTENWKSDGDTVRVNGVLHDSVEDAQRQPLLYRATRGVSPYRQERIAGIGDQAWLLEYPGNSQLVFSRGTRSVSMTVKTADTAKSTEIAKRFAKYYEQAIASAK
jgi:hypothetical protein